MLNRAPIFLNCFSRGGSNIFWNLFLSHPGVSSPMQETLEVFRTGLQAPTRAGYWVALLCGQWRVFDQWNLEDRPLFPGRAKAYIDRQLHLRRLTTASDPVMRFKAPGAAYSLAEIEATRLVAKNNNGLVFLRAALRDLYPDAVFFSLTREPIALYESHKRRGISRGVAAFAAFYRSIAQRMLFDAAQHEYCHWVRFEDLLADPARSTRDLYTKAGLDPGAAPYLRFKCKPHLQGDGSYGSRYETNSHRWFTPSEARAFLEPSINQLQAQRTSAPERSEIRAALSDLLPLLGYSDEVEPAMPTPDHTRGAGVAVPPPGSLAKAASR